MAIALAIILFLTVVLVVFSFGAAAYAPSSVLGSRLRSLGWQRTEPKEKTQFKERLEQALDPLSKALPLSPSDVSRTRKWLIQAGYREPRHLTIYVGSRLLLAMMAMAMAITIQGSFDLLLMIGVGAFGFFIQPPASHHHRFAGRARPHRDLRRGRLGAGSGPDASGRRLAPRASRPQR